MQPFDYFARIYCINLDSRPDRWHSCSEQFAAIGISDRVVRFPGVVHQDCIIGCAQSHMQIVDECMRDGLDNVLIFEDDVQFVDYDEEMLCEAIDDLSRRRWHMFYLGATINCPVVPISKRLLRVRGSLGGTQSYALHSSIFYRISQHRWPWGPGETSRSEDLGGTAQTIWDNNIVVRKIRHLDVFYSTCITPHYACYHINPLMCMQVAGYSDIAKCHVDYSAMQYDRFHWLINHATANAGLRRY